MIGERLGPYEILAKLGEGGMGEVYHAHDARLNRQVALKILPAHLVADPERRRRFVQEAQLASSLHHPHIVTVFDIGSAAAVDYIAMELVHGRTLDMMIPKGGLRVGEAVRYAIEIADALSVAHAAGIVHRDLKPGNIMVTDEGRIKVLDFGLATLTDRGIASAVEQTRAAPDLVDTGDGTVLGTVAYMSPEQAEGKRLDARSDLFSFGAILYEMLSGRRAFRADSGPATLAAVINLDPKPLGAVTAGIPEPLDCLVARCLRKDLTRRAQHASDIKVALEELRDDLSSGSIHAATSQTPRRSWVLTATMTFALVAVTVAAVRWWPRPETGPVTLEPVPLTALTGSERNPTFSPDGTQVAFNWQHDRTEGTDVYVHVIGSAGTPLRITDDGGDHRMPAWSPDGKFIAMWHHRDGQGSLVLVPPFGGPETVLLETTMRAERIAWSPDSAWLAVSSFDGTFVNRGQGVVLISKDARVPIEWAKLNPAYSLTGNPAFSPDGRRLAFFRATSQFTGELFTAGIDPDGRPSGEPVVLPKPTAAAAQPVWSPDKQEILYTERAVLFRMRLDGSRDPERVPVGPLSTFAVSPDGRLAFSRNSSDHDLVRVDLGRGQPPTPIASSTMSDSGAAYSPDGQRLVFKSNRSGSLEIWVADATGENAVRVTQFGEGGVFGTFRWSPDGRQIAFDRRPGSNSEIFVIPSGGGPVRQLTDDAADDSRPAFSPDGRWIYFSSNRSGAQEIWRVAAGGGKAEQITRTGGYAALPGKDGWLYDSRTQQEGLYRARFDGTDEELVVREAGGLLFLPTSSGVWYITRQTANLPRVVLHVLPRDARQPKEVLQLDFSLEASSMTLSPDERYLVVTRQDPRGSDLFLIDHFLPGSSR